MKRKMVRRLAALSLALLLALSLAACGGAPEEEKPAGNGTASGTQGSIGKPAAPKQDDPAQPDAPDTPDISDTPDDPETADTPDTPDTPDDPDTDPETPVEFTYSAAAQAAIEGLYVNYWHELFAASYLGYREEGDTGSLGAWLHDNCPMIASFWPFLEEIPQEDIIGEYGDLYCIVPMDASLTFTVKSVEWEQGGNGSVPHYSEPLYYPLIDRPFLLYVTYGTWRDETSLTVEYTQPDGFVGTWCPTYDPETGRLEEWCRDRVLDFAALYDIGDYIPHLEQDPAPDAEWLPPTNVGLGNTTWYSENGWVLDFRYDEAAGLGYGDMVLYQPVEDETGTTLSPYYEGTWWMEDDSLCLGVYEGNCPFPLLIAPSGEQMVIMRSDDGSVLPFFMEGQSIVGMTLSYE